MVPKLAVVPPNDHEQGSTFRHAHLFPIAGYAPTRLYRPFQWPGHLLGVRVFLFVIFIRVLHALVAVAFLFNFLLFFFLLEYF